MGQSIASSCFELRALAAPSLPSHDTSMLLITSKQAVFSTCDCDEACVGATEHEGDEVCGLSDRGEGVCFDLKLSEEMAQNRISCFASKTAEALSCSRRALTGKYIVSDR